MNLFRSLPERFDVLRAVSTKGLLHTGLSARVGVRTSRCRLVIVGRNWAVDRIDTTLYDFFFYKCYRELPDHNGLFDRDLPIASAVFILYKITLCETHMASKTLFHDSGDVLGWAQERDRMNSPCPKRCAKSEATEPTSAIVKIAMRSRSVVV